jgi:hypothetical protein
MKYMLRFLVCLALLCACVAKSTEAADPAATSIRGKLVQGEGRAPAIETTDHKLIALAGDRSTEHVLRDKRLAGMEFELIGHFTGAETFQIDPAYTHAVHVIKDGRRFMVTYWCEICSIRQYEPGPCWCCQRETNLDLRELDSQP